MNDENNLENSMKSHYNNPRLNAFNEELTIETIKENSRLFVSFPKGLKKHAIHNIMKQFGRVVKIDLPYDGSNASNKPFAFVEFMTFKEAEKALRELNHSKNEGLDIRAEFAHAKVPKSPNLEVPKIKNDDNYDEVEEIPVSIPISVKFQDYKVDDIVEKVSYFKYKSPMLTDLEENQQKYLKSCAEKSLGEYFEKGDFFEFNKQLREFDFLTFYCSMCENEATLKSDQNGRYFCTKECADSFEANKNPLVCEQTHYQVNPMDKVYLTAIINEQYVYVRSCDEDLDFLLELVYRNSKNCQPLKMLPEINEEVLIMAYGSFYRAQVLKIHESDRIIVKLVDIGNTLCVGINDAYEMTSKCKKIKRITTKVLLKNVKIEAINIDVINYLLSLLENRVELVVKEINENGIELKDNTANVSVNEQIVKLANFVAASFDNINDLPVVDDLGSLKDCKQRLFVVNVAMLKQLNGLVCVAENYVNDFHELYRSLNVYGQKVDPEMYGIYGHKSILLVKYNDQWHRGVVNEAKGDGQPICVLIDLQLSVKVNIKNIFKLPAAIAKFPIMSEIYIIEGYDQDENVKTFCDKIEENSFIGAEKVELKGGDFPVIFIDMTENSVI